MGGGPGIGPLRANPANKRWLVSLGKGADNPQPTSAAYHATMVTTMYGIKHELLCYN
jgi:hypothetical protein